MAARSALNNEGDSAASSELEAGFSAAADEVAAAVGVGGAALTSEQKLQLYGLYKQALEGPCASARPAFWELKGQSKWAAWREQGDTSKAAAMAAYVQLVQQLLPDRGQAGRSAESSVDAGARMDGSGGGGGREGSAGGAVFSSFALEEEPLPGSTEQLPLIVAASRGELAAVRQLLGSGGADVNERDADGCSALHWAADRGHPEVVGVLLESGADVNACDSDGQTPLHYAALCEQLSIAEALLAGGADARLLSEAGESAQQLAPDTWSCWPAENLALCPD